MKVIANIDYIITNEYEANCLNGIGPRISEIIKSGLQKCGKYRLKVNKEIDVYNIQNHMAMKRRQQQTNSKLQIPPYKHRKGSISSAFLFVIGKCSDMGINGMTREEIEKLMLPYYSKNNSNSRAKELSLIHI